jgi:phosphoglycolate phosphatase-like HAD superfamily hydrolase
MRTVVFDIDGTIADNSHRKQWVEQRPKDWKRYNENMVDDGVHEDIVSLMVMLSATNKIILCTGREDVYAPETWLWLDKNDLAHLVHDIYMRRTKDYRSDAIVKVELLERITADYSRPWLWFDDRQQVVDAIRAQGIRVLQVAPGNF